MKIPFSNQYPQHLEIKDRIESEFESLFKRGDFVLGEAVSKFEQAFARYCDVGYAVGVNSGTDALYFTLAALGIKEGDEVIVPNLTFISTANSVSFTGATPVLADIEPITYNIDYTKLESVLTKNTKAIVPVHLYGQSAHMDEINAFAKKHNLFVVEDAAQANGALYKDKKIGSLSDAGCFSFYPTKGLGAYGDAGMIVTNDKQVFEKISLLRNHGSQGKKGHKGLGFNSRLDTIQAIVLLAKLEKLDQWNQMRQDNAKYYCNQLKNVPGITLPKALDDRTHVFQTFAIRIQNRDQILEELISCEIDARVHYRKPLHREGFFEDSYDANDENLKESIALADETLSLPMYPHLTKEEMDFVCQSLKNSASILK